MANHATKNIIVLLQKYMTEYNIQNVYVNLYCYIFVLAYYPSFCFTYFLIISVNNRSPVNTHPHYTI